MKKELLLDSTGMCRFHRGWAEDMLPQIIESLYGMQRKSPRVSANVRGADSPGELCYIERH